ncbi:MAG: ComEA family DNA-binding protein [Veillonellaceae bacterium]|jgi:competence protein ComEA|nr:ComEA family DNA-binding protein [Veillonellaceae bacterium]
MVDEQKKRLLLLATLTVIILCGSCYAYWQKNSAPESVAVPTNLKANKESRVNQEELTVYITGAVMQPGVIKVQAGTRIIDVINAAGGLAQGAEVSKLNLAKTVKDGMHIKVSGGAELPRTAVRNDSNRAAGNKININTATKGELDKLPGIGPTLAQRIIDYRQANGHFKNIADIKKVSGISEKRYNKLKDNISI